MDVFISHAHADKPVVERLAVDLVKAGLTVWYDEWQLSLGDSLRKKISEGLARSTFLAVVLTKSSVSSKWVEDEVYAALAIAEEEERVVVLPILLEDCQIPVLLKDKIYVDFRDSYDEGLQKLIQRVKLADPTQVGRTKSAGWTTDYSLDWTSVSGDHQFRAWIIAHGDSQPATFVVEIFIQPFAGLNERIAQYVEKGFRAQARAFAVSILAQAIDPGAKVWVEDEVAGVIERTSVDPRLGMGCEILVEVRRMGMPTEKGVVYGIGKVIHEFAEWIGFAAKAEVNDEALKEYLAFIHQRPLGS